MLLTSERTGKFHNQCSVKILLMLETAQTKMSDIELETPTVNNLVLDSQDLGSIQFKLSSLSDGENIKPWHE